MTERAGLDPAFHDVEEMVRAAGRYLEVSDDLRPRVLEEARADRRETSTRSKIVMLAIAVCLLAIGFTESVSSLGVRPGDEQPFVEVERAAGRGGWSLVDSFQGLRRRQGSLIDGAFWYLRPAPDRDQAAALRP